ncbi:MAG: acyloxyacyl hydrolase, partial [Candidatus Rokuibacteriota bacterium]
MSVGIRGGLTGWSVIGADEIESFQRHDVVATVGLPWSWHSESAWGLDTGLMASAGALLGAGEAGFIGTLTSVLTLRSQDGRFSVDGGMGGALLTRHKFGDQQFGGPFQLVLTWGFRVPVYRAIGVGYRYQHLSDADIYGNPS